MEEQKVVNTEDSSPSEQSVVSEQGEGTPVVSPEQQTTETQPHDASPALDRPVQNIEAEWRRKYENLVEKLPTMVEEAVNKKPQQEKKYSIAELEAYALDNPQYRPWVEEQKEKIREEKIAARLEEQRKSDETARYNEQLRIQAEQAVSNDPRFADAFTTDVRGMKVWNQNSKLTQMIAAYINEPELRNRPDRVLIAAKLARADLMDSTVPQVTQQLQSLKRQNTVLKQKTMPESGGVPVQAPAKDPLREAQERLAKSGTEADAQKYLSEYFKSRNK